MNRILAALTVISLLGIWGCEVSSPRGGGVAAADGFNLVVARPDMELKQGAIETLSISVARGDSFKQDVKLEVRADKGISVDPGSIAVKASEPGTAMIHVSADKNAAV